jgi:hypothetical protein
MPKGRQLVACMFCGLTRPTSIEDVIYDTREGEKRTVGNGSGQSGEPPF